MKINLTKLRLFVAIPTLAMGLTYTSAIAAPFAAGDAALKQQVAELQAKIKQLEAALPAKAASPALPTTKMTPAPAMPGMPPSAGGAMGMGDMKTGGMPMSPPVSPPMPGGMGGMMTGMMGMMDQMMAMSAMPAASPGMPMTAPALPQSALPGFPGLSHLYHIGSTGFFLEHAAHISLTTEQQAALNKLKDQALAAKTNSDREIEQAEREMATLTSADQPDSAKLETKVRDIEKLRTNERLAFIRAVGEAANLLTDDQRKMLTGAMQSPAPSATMSPMSHM